MGLILLVLYAVNGILFKFGVLGIRNNFLIFKRQNLNIFKP